LIVCDQNAPAVDVIAPPYTSITRTLGSGFSDPFHVTINKKNSRAYVADYVTGQVYVLKYPSGKTVATLGTSNGISAAWSAVDSDNFVP
jgi:DNA-binding beta-propeller fold protein YncE